MSATTRFAAYPPSRLEWHPAHEEVGAVDSDTFDLHVEFVHAHGVPKGQFTTFSTCNLSSRHVASDASASSRPSRTAL
jgi:hypothetical protein